MALHNLLFKRDDNCEPDIPYCSSYVWYSSETAYIIRWAVGGTLVVMLLAFLLFAYLHARRRMKRGLPPLRYHAWLVSRRERAQFYRQHGQPAQYYHNAPYGHEHGMPLNTYPGPPPPAYGEHDYVPPYQPPEGSSKINPDQHYQNVYTGASSSQQPPPGPTQPHRVASTFR